MREIGTRRRAPIDWAGDLTFASGLILVMIGITYGIRPYGGDAMGWRSPLVVGCLATGCALLALFVLVENRVAQPMFELALFRIRAFSAGALATFLASLARGGLMFMLIIWLQGIWLPQHGHSFESTPLWAALSMMPLTLGFLLAGPVFGHLSDRYGPRRFATTGMLGSAIAFGLLELLPIDFPYALFAALLLLMGISMGFFAAPNRAGVMNSLPPEHRGAGGGMNQTFQNSAQVLSIGIFFTLMIIGLSATLPHTLATGLAAHGVPARNGPAGRAAAPGLGPLRRLPRLQPRCRPCSGRTSSAMSRAANAATLSGRGFFPQLIERPVSHRSARGLRLRHRRLPDRRVRIVDSRHAPGQPSRRHGTGVSLGVGRSLAGAPLGRVSRGCGPPDHDRLARRA